MKLTVDNLQEQVRIWETMARFDEPLNDLAKSYLKETGFGDGYTRAVGCMGWIWCQWLGATPEAEVRKRVETFVERGIEMQGMSANFRWRSRHDLDLLHCAIFASSEAQLKRLAERVVDASGYNGQKPKNDGELYTSAWSGMLKYWILGDREKAAKQSEIIWASNRPTYSHAGTKVLVTPWLKRDWSAFVKCQQKDFDKFWNRSRKDKTVIKESSKEIVVNIDALSSIEQLGCWSHSGLALLAHRQGVDVATDHFWLPLHALKCAPRSSN